MGKSFDEAPSVPHRCGRQRHQANIPAEDSETCDHCALILPFLDQLIVEIKSRFLDTHEKAVLGLSLIPTAMEEDRNAKALMLAQLHHDDLPYPNSSSVELYYWQLK